MRAATVAALIWVCGYRVGCDCTGAAPTPRPCTESDAGAGDGGNDTDGGADAGSAGDGGILPSTITVDPVYPLNGANWLDYVVNAGGAGHAWDRPDAPCTGTEPGYFKCLHGAELRRFQPPNLGSCAGLTATDALDAFDWVCDATGGAVTFRSRGLKAHRGLRDLIDGATMTFKPNAVTVRRSGVAVFLTASTRWWSNPIAPVPTGTTPLPLGSDTLYVAVATQDFGGLFITSQSKVGLVTLAGATLTYRGPTTTWCTDTGGYLAAGGGLPYGPYAVCAGGPTGAESRFLWLEASIDSTPGMNTGGIELAGVQMTRVHATELTGYGYGNGFDMSGNTGNAVLFDECAANFGTGVGGPSTGFWLPNGATRYVTLRGCTSANSADGVQATGTHLLVYGSTFFNNDGNSGVNISGAGGINLVGNTVFANGTGFSVGCNPCTVLANAAFNNNTGAAITGGNVTVVNLVVAGATGTGVDVNVSGGPTRLTDVVSTDSVSGFEIRNVAGNAVTFSGLIAVGGNSARCNDPGGKSNLLDSNCARAAGQLISAGAPAASFTGVVTTDSANGSALPSPVFSQTGVDWAHFSNPYRGWGAPPIAALFSPASPPWCGRGGSATCTLYDFTLVPNEPVMLLKRFYGAWPNDGTCPAFATPISDGQGNTFQPQALELLDPWYNPNGDYDGLCEGGEGCVFTPNLGAYQGSADPFTSVPCTYAGLNPPATVWAYPAN